MPHTEQENGTRRMGPSQVRNGDLYTVRLYLQAGTDPQVYENVKHAFWQAGGTVLGILQTFPEDDTHRYLYWPREALLWFQVTQQRFEDGWRSAEALIHVAASTEEERDA